MFMGCLKLAHIEENEPVFRCVWKSSGHSKQGVNWYDYGTRFYDPSMGRFHTVDPLASDYYFQSPYVYAGNNPITLIDYYGAGPWDIVKGVGLITGGVIQTVGGAVIVGSTAPTGVGPIAGAAIMTNGVSNIGWGMAVLVNNGKKDIPSGNAQGLGRGLDNHTGNENNSYEKAGTILDFAFSLPGGTTSDPAKLIEGASDLVSLASTVETVSELSQSSPDQTTSDTNNTETTSTSKSQNTLSEKTSSSQNSIPTFDIKDLIRIEPIKQDNTQARKFIEPIGQ